MSASTAIGCLTISWLTAAIFITPETKPAQMQKQNIINLMSFILTNLVLSKISKYHTSRVNLYICFSYLLIVAQEIVYIYDTVRYF